MVTQDPGERAAAPKHGAPVRAESRNRNAPHPGRNRVSSTHSLHASRVHSQEAPHLLSQEEGDLQVSKLKATWLIPQTRTGRMGKGGHSPEQKEPGSMGSQAWPSTAHERLPGGTS